MTTPAASIEEFDLQPHPRILPILGEISLDQWRCVAELIDNSVDAFLYAQRANHSIERPEIHITIPIRDNPNAKITVRDNGPGMGPETLENAVRAGWTSNDPISNLGMFGMGFNIATARLGTVTTVWTTREGDREWFGLEIDFDKLIQQRHYRTPKKTRPKIDPTEHGTEVSIERLKPEQRQWFAKPANRTRINKELGRVYSAMLRPNGVPISFRLLVNGDIVRGRYHCIWGGEGNPSRAVNTARYGEISAYQSVDVRLGDRPFCMKCWTWLSFGENVCSACGSSDITIRPRRVYGWLGIQRYLSDTDYGIDFIRNGRKIEVASRDLFVWNNGESQESEYPIDDPRHRGRIVGEIHIDHCRLSYMKDRFDRNDPAWEEMVRIVRGEGPLRPDKASELGFGDNGTPLFLLFQAFRRSSPKPKVAGCYAKLLIIPDNDRAEQLARRFYTGEAEYQTDSRWWELVEEADRQLLTPPPPERPGNGNDDDDDLFGGDDIPPGGDAPAPPAGVNPPRPNNGAEQPPPPPPLRTSLPSLSREYIEDSTRLRWDVRAFAVEPSDLELGGRNKAWRLKLTTAGISEFYVNEEHSIFRSATMTPLDALLAEMACSAIDFQRSGQSSFSFAEVLANLREKYAGITKLDPISLSNEAVTTLSGIARGLSRNLETEDSVAFFGELSPAEQEAILGKMATRSIRNPQQVISEGRFLEFAPTKTLLRFFERHPELFFDGRYWDNPYANLDFGLLAATEEAQSQVARYYASLLTDAAWLAEQDPNELRGASRARLLRAALALDLLAPTAEPENEP